MSENAQSEGHVADDHGHDDHDHHHVNYKKIYFILVGLFVVSVVGPELGIRSVTLVTAFGIAIVKANLVIQNFMHLKWEKRLMKWMLTTSLILMGVFLAGTSPDVMNHEGNNWENLAAQAAVERGLAGEEAEEGGEEIEVVVGFNAAQSYGIACASCHGAEGAGDGVAGALLDPAPANFTDPAFWAERDMDRIVNVITNGATVVGGSPLMVGWNLSFDADQIQQLADYVATFRPE